MRPSEVVKELRRLNTQCEKNSLRAAKLNAKIEKDVNKMKEVVKKLTPDAKGLYEEKLSKLLWL